jgi:hypothetical protein
MESTTSQKPEDF